MQIQLTCPHCDHHVVFEPSKARARGGRLMGSCVGCRSVYSLYGGQLSPIDVRPTPSASIPATPAAPAPVQQAARAIQGGSLSLSVS